MVIKQAEMYEGEMQYLVYASVYVSFSILLLLSEPLW